MPNFFGGRLDRGMVFLYLIKRLIKNGAMSHDPKNEILDAAEAAFAQLGYEGTSMRLIASKAGVNLATLYYHFGSKDGLLEAILQRRFEPVIQRQLHLLQQIQTTTQTSVAAVRNLLHAILIPILESIREPASRTVGMLIGRMLTEPARPVQEILRRRFKDVSRTFIQTVQRMLPSLSEEDVAWRVELMWGGIAFLLCQPENVIFRTNGRCNPLDYQKALAHMTQFFVGGLLAKPLRKDRAV